MSRNRRHIKEASTTIKKNAPPRGRLTDEDFLRNEGEETTAQV